MGAGADVFSAGEVALALGSGMRPASLLFNGSSKTPPADLALAVEKGGSASPWTRPTNSGNSMPWPAKREEPSISPSGSTRRSRSPHPPEDRDGACDEQVRYPGGSDPRRYREALALEHVNPVGIHCHIGSQILAVEPFAREVEVLIDVARDLIDIGGVEPSFIDIGGGLGIPPYRRETDRAPTPEEYAGAVMPVFKKGIKDLGIEPELWVEPGRWLVGDSTILLTRINSVKTAHKTFANVDAGFNLLIRPTMYDSYHEVVAANKADAPAVREYSVTGGPICETGDILAKDRMLPPELAAGDLIAVLDAGGPTGLRCRRSTTAALGAPKCSSRARRLP